jgi:hypothetical protein
MLAATAWKTYTTLVGTLVMLTSVSSHDCEPCQHVRRCFQDNKVVFIGDSLTRFQYLNLINALHTGSWQTIRPSIVSGANVWVNWKSFHLSTNVRFGCNEICDCYRDAVNYFKENRHY